MPVNKTFLLRSTAGSTLGLVAVTVLLTLIIGVLAVYAIRIICGNQELNNASDAGILNATKQALVEPAIALSDSTLPNANTLPYSDFAAFSDQQVNKSPSIDLQTYNRCVAQAIIVSANALAINNATAFANATKVCQAVQGLGKTLQNQFKSHPLNNEFSRTANANHLGLLGISQKIKLNVGLIPSYVSDGQTLASSIWLDPSILPGYDDKNPTNVINQKDLKIPLDEKAKNQPNKSSDPNASPISTWITGYAPITINLGGSQLTLYAVALSPTTLTHLIDSGRFNSSLNPPDGNTPPNSFSSRDSGVAALPILANSTGSQGSIHPSKGTTDPTTGNSNNELTVSTISCAIVGCNDNYSPALMPSGYIRITNSPPATSAVPNVRYNAANSYFDQEGASKEAINPGCFWVSPATSMGYWQKSPKGQTQTGYYRLVCNNLILLQEWYDFACTAVDARKHSAVTSQEIGAYYASHGLEVVNGFGYDPSKDPLKPYGTTAAQLFQQIGINGDIPAKYLSGAKIYCWTLVATSDPTSPISHDLSDMSTTASLGNMLFWTSSILSNGPNKPDTDQNYFDPTAAPFSWDTNYDYKKNSVNLSTKSAANSNSEIERYLGYVSGMKTVSTADIKALVTNATSGGTIKTNMIPVVDHYYDGTAAAWMVDLAKDLGTFLKYSIATSSDKSDLASISIVRWLKEKVMSLMNSDIQGAAIAVPPNASSGMMNYQRCGVNPDKSAAHPYAYLVHYAEYGAMATVVGNDLKTYNKVSASPTIESYGSPAQLLTQIVETLNGPLPVTSTVVSNGLNANYLKNKHSFDKTMPEFQTLMSTLLQRCREIDPQYTLQDIYNALGWNDITQDPNSKNFYNTNTPTLPMGTSIYLYKDPKTGNLVCGSTLPIQDTQLQPEGVGTAYGEIDVSTGWYAVCGDTTFSSGLNSMVNVDQDGTATAKYCGDAGVHRRPYLYQDSVCQAMDKVAFMPATGLNNFLGQLTFSTSLRATGPQGKAVVNTITFNGEN